MRGILGGTLLALIVSAAAPVRAETELVVASFPGFDQSVKLAIPRFEKLRPDVHVKLVSHAFGDHHAAMLRALASGRDVPDVMAVEIGFIGSFADSNGLEDLGAAPYDGKPLLDKFLEFTRSQSSSGASILAAMPADVGPGTLLYRKDILDKAGVTEEELTRSWESYIEAGKKIKAATGAYLLAHAFDIKDVYVRGSLKDGDAVYVMGSPVRCRAPLLDSPRFKRAFELARSAREAGLDARVGTWSNEWAEGLRNGTIATQMTGSWMVGHLSTWLAPETKGLWRAAQLPGGAFATWGGSFYAIPKLAAHKAEAWVFIKFMTLDRQQQLDAYRALDAWPALLAAQDDPFVDEPVAFLGGQKARQLWKVAAAKAPALLVSRADPFVADWINAQLELVLEKGKPIGQALKDAPSGCSYHVRK
jgi:multiple sugar transport system substrate-binding protein